jgi:formamidopyrimidine-DNA glycosylase
MPELPEVETVARSLIEGQGVSEGILGLGIREARVGWKRSIAEPSAAEFVHRIQGQCVEGVGRRGKFIRMELSEDTLLVHLRMSGELVLDPVDAPQSKYSRVQLYFEKGVRLSFNDARKFGRVWLVEDPETILAKLGPEPLDSTLKPAAFHAMLTGRKRQLKPLLLDQSFLAGLGNIYVDEALHYAKLHPLTSSAELSKEQARELLKGIRKVLRDSIKANGSSIDWAYRGGEFQNKFKVYQKTGEPCPRCGAPIERIVVGQRGTHLCPKCQKQ